MKHPKPIEQWEAQPACSECGGRPGRNPQTGIELHDGHYARCSRPRPAIELLHFPERVRSKYKAWREAIIEDAQREVDAIAPDEEVA